MKKCTKCGIEKELGEFYKHSKCRDGRAAECKTCYKERVKKYEKTMRGLICRMYTNQLANSKKRCHPNPSYTRDKFKTWILSQSVFYVLFSNWVASGFEKNITPSCDRIDSSKPYSIDNLQVVTWRENLNNYHKEHKVSVCSYDAFGNIVSFYKSISDAARDVGAKATNISKVCNGHKKTCCGYFWKKC